MPPLLTPASKLNRDSDTSQADVLSLWNGRGLSADDPAVCIARVRSGSEGMLETFCAMMNVATVTFREAVCRWRRNGDGREFREVTHRTVFTGNVFIGDGEKGRDAFAIFRKRFGGRFAYSRQDVRVAQQPRLRDDLIRIAYIFNNIGAGEPRQIRPGTRARVISGPMMGFEGIIVHEASGGRFMIPLDFFGQLIPTEVPIENLEAI